MFRFRHPRRALAGAALLATLAGAAAAQPAPGRGLVVRKVTRTGAQLQVDYSFSNRSRVSLTGATLVCTAYDPDGAEIDSTAVPLDAGAAPGATQTGSLWIPLHGARPQSHACRVSRGSREAPRRSAPASLADHVLADAPPPGAWVTSTGGCAYDRASRALVWRLGRRSCLPVWPPGMAMD